MKRKDKLLMIMALNALSFLANAETRHEKLYNNIIKNVNIEKSNNKSYKLIENILKKRNKELNDLYIQADYILKPEYLEWQVFTSGEYRNKNRSGKKDEIINQEINRGNTISKYINMPKKDIGNVNINVEKPTITIPDVSVPENNVTIPDIGYNSNIDVPTFDMPEFVDPIVSEFNMTVSTSSLLQAGSSEDKTFYNPGLSIVEIWNTGLFSNYNLESGDFTFDSVRDSVSSTGFSYNNAVGSIDSTAVLNPALNQPVNIPVSDSNVIAARGTFSIVSTSSPNIRIGENVNISYTSKDAYNVSNLVPLFHLKPLNNNRSALNADPLYSYGGERAYSGARSDVRFSIMRSSAIVNGYGNNVLFGAVSRNNNQAGSRNDYILVNDGKIIGNYNDSRDKNHYGFAFSSNVGRGNFNERYILINDGEMEFRAPNSQGFIVSGVNVEKAYIVQNRGKLSLYGSKSIGVLLNHGSLSGSKPDMDDKNVEILIENPINVQGDGSAGLYLNNHYADLSKSIFKVNIGTEKNEYSGNINGNDSNYVENSVGLFIFPIGNTGENLKSEIKNYELKFGDFAKNSVLFYNQSGRANSYYYTDGTLNITHTLVLDNSNLSSMDVDAGTNNVMIYNKGRYHHSLISYIAELTVKPDLNIGNTSKNVDYTTAIYNEGSVLHLLGNINTYGNQSHGLYTKSIGPAAYKYSGMVDNKDEDGNIVPISIITNEESSTAIYNNEGDVSFAGNTTFKALGNNGAVIYNKNGTFNLSGDALLEAGNNGVILYGQDGIMNLDGNITYDVKNNSVFSIVDQTKGIQASFTGNQTLNLSDGGIGFLYEGDGISLGSSTLTNYLNSYYSGLGNLNINIDENSRLFVINNYGTANLSTFSELDSGENIFGSVNGTGKGNFLNRGILILDTPGIIDLNDQNNIYVKTEKQKTGIIVNSDVTLDGSNSGIIALAGKNNEDGFQMNMENNGIINLSGSDSVAIYAENGSINNNSFINISGENSAGLFSENGTTVLNSGNINIGNNSVGIYGVSYQEPLNPSENYGNGNISITNRGIIEAFSSSKALGIYMNNNKSGGSRTDGTLFLEQGTSIIDMSESEEGTGIYANNSTVTGGGIISVGKNGTGIYAKNTDLNLSDLTLNLKGDNSLGIYLDSGSNLNSSGTNIVNISGKGNTVFYINTDGAFNQNFLINSSSDSSYTIASLLNRKINYNGTAVSGDNSNFFYVDHSSVTLDSDTVLTAEGSNATGMYADGLYNNGISDFEAVNNGEIKLTDDSVGLYSKNGARLENNNKISAGSNSSGLFVDFNGAARNKGFIEIKGESIGIAAKNALKVENSGSIISDGDNSIGIYSLNDNNLEFSNTGTIKMSGLKSVGVYLDGSGTQTFNNNGSIETAYSDNISSPNIGVYNVNSIFNNNGDISSGINSLGVYNSGTLNMNSGKISSGTGGIAIYSDTGTVNMAGGQLSVSDNGVGNYAVNNTNIINTATNISVGDNSITYILESGSTLVNRVDGEIRNNGIFVYGENAGNVDNLSGTMKMNGTGNIGFYLKDSGALNNHADIQGLGAGNTGIYSNGESITNTGNITLGDSEIINTDNMNQNKYAIGIYSEGAEVLNTGRIKVGNNGTALYIENGNLVNSGDIISDGEYAAGIWGNKNATIKNDAAIILNGDNSKGIIGTDGSVITNNGVITLNGNNSVGIYGDLGTKIFNSGTINLNGSDSTGIMLSNGAVFENTGIINLGSGSNNVEIGNGSNLTPPSIINAGVIKVDGKFTVNNVDIIIKVDPSTIKAPEMNDITNGGFRQEDLNSHFLSSSAVQFKADGFDFNSPAFIDPLFTQGTNALVYKFEDVFQSDDIQQIESITVDSKSVTFKATPVINEDGNLDVWMEKIPYKDFANGAWFQEFTEKLDENYFNPNITVGQTEEALKIYDKLDLMQDENTLKLAFENLSGSVYANMNQREIETSDIFANSLKVLQDSKNNTKENVKINIIGGKGKIEEKTSGVHSYDYTTTGIQALREVERTYKHTFGYSLGYLHTKFDFKGSSESEEQVDSIQLGVHNKYNADNWQLRNDFTGRVSFHNVDRNMDWMDSNIKSKMNGTYETYSITSDNVLGREFELGKKVSVMPYGGINAMYVTRPAFSERGDEALEIKGNDAWSVKPRIGVEVKSSLPLGKTENWKLKSSLDIAYEYELAGLNIGEKAKLKAVENEYHKLSKPENEKGVFQTKALIGIELQDKYGIFLTGEYKIGKNNNENNEYRAGINLKATF